MSGPLICGRCGNEAIEATFSCHACVMAEREQAKTIIRSLFHEDRSALRAASLLGEFTAADFARFSGITPQGGNNQLARLVRLGVLTRRRLDGKGVRFGYSMPEIVREALT